MHGGGGELRLKIARGSEACFKRVAQSHQRVYLGDNTALLSQWRHWNWK